jgi:DNA-binding NtrC family response regulator
MAAMIAPIASGYGAVENEAGTRVGLGQPCAHILSVSQCQTDHTALRRIIDDTQWRLSSAASCHEAFEKLCGAYPLVVFSDSSLPDGTWKEVFELISRFEGPHSFLVVASRLADEGLWSEVLNLGGYDVLMKPLIEEEVRRVLDSIWVRRAYSVPRTRVLRAGS